MTHISFRISDAERLEYAMLPIYEEKTLTEIIKGYLNRLVKKHKKEA